MPAFIPMTLLLMVPGLADIVDNGATLTIDPTTTPDLMLTDDLVLGRTGFGRLEVLNGGVVSDAGADGRSAALGVAADATGRARVSGAGSRWTADSADIGVQGTADVLIERAGWLMTRVARIGAEPGSSGTVTVDGPGSRLQIDTAKIGFGGNGALQISGGATVGGANGYAGELVGAVGTISVAGAGSDWSLNHALYLGIGGSAELDVRQGGRVSSGTVLAAQNLSSSAVIALHGDDVVWSMTGSLFLGGNAGRRGGTASLAISDGAALTVGQTLHIWPAARMDLAGGRLEVARLQADGPVVWSGGTFARTLAPTSVLGTDVGDAFTITDGAPKAIGAGSSLDYAGTIRHETNQPLRFEAGATVRIRGNGWYRLAGNGDLVSAGADTAILNEGTFEKSEGTGESLINVPFTNSGDVIARRGTLHFAAGFLQSEGQTDLSGGLIRSSGDFRIAAGTLRGPGRIEGDLTNTGGTVRTGAGPDTFTIDGSYTQGPGATLRVQLHIPEPPEAAGDQAPGTGATTGASSSGTAPRVLTSDRFEISGAVSLAGDLEIALLGGHPPLPDDTFEFLTYGALAGALRPLEATGPGFTAWFDIIDLGTSLALVPDRVVLVAAAPPEATVAEPGAATCMFAGLLLMVRRRPPPGRRRP